MLNSKYVITHDKTTYPAKKINHCSEILDFINDYDVFGFDEGTYAFILGHFFTNLHEICEHLAYNNKIIIVSSLNANYKRNIFPSIQEIIPKADNIIFLKAKCSKCGLPATITQIKTNNIYCSDIIVGGNELYFVLCRKCFNLIE